MTDNKKYIIQMLEKEHFEPGDRDHLVYLFQKEGHDIQSILCSDVKYGMQLILKLFKDELIQKEK